eukprot:CAMPEP_0183368016 /NCGR_PEP_ID=MMETSP0164_2-20130417/94420_1 /TAXON_ID=221442 /ORGANISM="Coccolithus pelagicus ssp braarudi, Strain PLY182g" /LENGTH=152 /DNA_ID=CAMNT_0025544041 /DNA_START=79 /DNA_END=534 /DNA_ORIENTATION=+
MVRLEQAAPTTPCRARCGLRKLKAPIRISASSMTVATLMPAGVATRAVASGLPSRPQRDGSSLRLLPIEHRDGLGSMSPRACLGGGRLIVGRERRERRGHADGIQRQVQMLGRAVQLEYEHAAAGVRLLGERGKRAPIRPTRMQQALLPPKL